VGEVLRALECEAFSEALSRALFVLLALGSRVKAAESVKEARVEEVEERLRAALADCVAEATPDLVGVGVVALRGEGVARVERESEFRGEADIEVEEERKIEGECEELRLPSLEAVAMLAEAKGVAEELRVATVLADAAAAVALCTAVVRGEGEAERAAVGETAVEREAETLTDAPRPRLGEGEGEELSDKAPLPERRGVREAKCAVALSALDREALAEASRLAEAAGERVKMGEELGELDCDCVPVAAPEALTDTVEEEVGLTDALRRDDAVTQGEGEEVRDTVGEAEPPLGEAVPSAALALL
jgi:hypothetical protein